MKKKYQIFISSTYEDLKKERKKIQDSILKMQHFPIGMEHFSAANRSQWKIIQETIDKSDYYILVIGRKNGTIINEGPDKGLSYTEKEYNYAISKGIPVLAFIMDESVPRTDVQRENTEAAQKKLKKFIEKVRNDRPVEQWKTSEDLINKVVLALMKEIDETPRPGWNRYEHNNLVAKDNNSVVLKRLHTTKSPLDIIEMTKEELFISGITMKSWVGCISHLMDKKDISIKILAMNTSNESLVRCFKEARNNGANIPPLDELIDGLKNHPDVEIRLIDSMTPLLFVGSDYNSTQGYIKVQPLMNSYGASKSLCIEVESTHNCYSNYLDQINAIWKRGKTCLKSKK